MRKSVWAKLGASGNARLPSCGCGGLASCAVGVLLMCWTLSVCAAELRVAVVGGLELCGFWPGLAARIEAATGVRIVTVPGGPKEAVVPLFRSGAAELLLIHGGDEAFALTDEAIAGAIDVWGFNGHVLVGPADDPARVGEAASAVEAFRRLSQAGSPFVAFRDPGSHGIVQRLWRRAGVHADPKWVLLDETRDPHEILAFAQARRAYVVVGHIPVAFGKLPLGNLRVLHSGDPAMRRAYVALTPGRLHPAGAASREAARIVVEHLLSSAGQRDLIEADAEAGGPWVYPRAAPAQE